MTDERLRELERRWKETGSVDDEAAFLLERVRAGDLAQEWLGLAARCYHRAAAQATGERLAAPPADLERWLVGVECPIELLVEIAYVFAGVVREEFPHAATDRVMVEAAAWLACPCAHHASETQRAGEETEPNLVESATQENWRLSPQHWGGWAALSLADCVVSAAMEDRAAATEATIEVFNAYSGCVAARDPTTALRELERATSAWLGRPPARGRGTE